MKYLFVLFSLLVLNACKDTSNTKKEAIPKTTTVETSIDKEVVLIKNPTSVNSHLPRLFSNGKELYMSWVTRKDKTDYLNYSKFDGNNWMAQETITKGDDWFINWADYPVISESNGSILTTYLQKSDTATYAYDIKFNLYSSQTKTWKKDMLLHSDGTKTEHGFVSAIPSSNGFEVAWLDGRNTAGGHGDHDSHGAGGAMTLRSALITPTGEVINETELDNRVCDCCQTSIASSVNGTIVAYRDRSKEEVRDISIVHKAITGHLDAQIQSFSNDNWKIAGCPVNGPAIDAFDTTFGIAWFTAADGEGQVKVSFLGKDSKEPIRIDNGNATGRVALKMISKTEALVLWMEPRGDKEVIALAKVDISGKKTSEIIISKTSPERASGFPQLEVMGANAYIAWTEVEEKIKSIKTAKVAISNLE